MCMFFSPTLHLVPRLWPAEGWTLCMLSDMFLPLNSVLLTLVSKVFFWPVLPLRLDPVTWAHWHSLFLNQKNTLSQLQLSSLFHVFLTSACLYCPGVKTQGSYSLLGWEGARALYWPAFSSLLLLNNLHYCSYSSFLSMSTTDASLPG